MPSEAEASRSLRCNGIDYCPTRDASAPLGMTFFYPPTSRLLSSTHHLFFHLKYLFSNE